MMLAAQEGHQGNRKGEVKSSGPKGEGKEGEIWNNSGKNIQLSGWGKLRHRPKSFEVMGGRREERLIGGQDGKRGREWRIVVTPKAVWVKRGQERNRPEKFEKKRKRGKIAVEAARGNE